MNIIAIDLGKFNSIDCFFDTETNKHRFQLIKTERDYPQTLLTSEPSDLEVMDACTASGWVSGPGTPAESKLTSVANPWKNAR